MFASTKLRYSSKDDIILLKEVCSLNPYTNPSMWFEVHSNFMKCSGRKMSLRSVKEHTEHLSKLWLKKDIRNLRKNGSQEQVKEKEQLLDKVKELRDAAIQKNNWKTERYQHPTFDLINVASTPLIESVESVALSEDMDTDKTTEFEDANERPVPPRRLRRRNYALQFLEKKMASERSLKNKDQELEERRLKLEEDKLALEEKKEERRSAEQQRMLTFINNSLEMMQKKDEDMVKTLQMNMQMMQKKDEELAKTMQKKDEDMSKALQLTQELTLKILDFMKK